MLTAIGAGFEVTTQAVQLSRCNVAIRAIQIDHHSFLEHVDRSSYFCTGATVVFVLEYQFHTPFLSFVFDRPIVDTHIHNRTHESDLDTASVAKLPEPLPIKSGDGPDITWLQNTSHKYTTHWHVTHVAEQSAPQL